MNTKTHIKPHFLLSGGEMGKLIGEKNWSQTSLGDISEWPQSLLTTLSIILNSKFPMFLFWGQDLICFYNDAYRPSLGNDGKHPFILGQNGSIAWKEIWIIIKPIIDNVLAGKEASWYEDQLIPIYRNGKIEDVYWTFSYSPVSDETGNINGVIVVCNETTKKVIGLKKLSDSSNQLEYLLNNAPIALCILKGTDFIIDLANNETLKVWGKNKTIIGKKLINAAPELMNQPFIGILNKVYTTGETYTGNENATYIDVNGNLELIYLNLVFKPLLDADGHVYGILGMGYDVTEQVENKKKLAESRERLLLATEGAELGTWDLNLQTLALIHSPRMALIFGHPSSSILTHIQMRKQVHLEDIKMLENKMEAALHTGDYSYEARIIRTDNTQRWIRTIGKVIFDEHNIPLRILGTTRDITEEKNHLQRVEESESRLRIAAVSSELGTWDYNPFTGVLIWDNATKKLFGVEEDAAITLEIFMAKLHKDDKELTKQKMMRALDPEIAEAYDTEFRVAGLENKAIRWIHAKGKALFDENNNAYRFSGTVLDITEKKLALEELKANEQKFRLLSDSMPQFIWTAGPDGVLNFFNSAVYHFSGFTFEQLNNGGWVDMVHPDDKEENIKQWLHSISSGESFLFEHRFKRHDGEYRWQLSRALPRKDDAGNIQIWVGSSTDIDDLKKHDQQKDDFIKMASHELKTPVTTIKGYVQLLMKMNSDGENVFLSNSLQTINNQVGKLTKLISDLLDVTKIETGSLTLTKEVICMGDIVEEIAKDLQATRQTHTIQVNIIAKAYVLADRDRISQVMINLFTNAIKYSPKANKILTQLTVKDERVIVAVQDFGIGLAKEDYKKIFDRFYRVAGKDEKTFPGFGIGLFIVNEIIQQHHGEIWVNSEKGKGSTFYFSLPIHS